MQSSGLRGRWVWVAVTGMGALWGCSSSSPDPRATVETCDLQLEVRDRSARLVAAAGPGPSAPGDAQRSSSPPLRGDRGAEGDAPEASTACPAAAGTHASPGPLSAAVRPVIVAGRGADDGDVERAAVALRRGMEAAQRWVADTVASRTGLERSFDLDRPVILRPPAAELAGGPEDLVGSLIAAGAIQRRQQVILVVGSGSTWLELRHAGGDPAGLVIGDSVAAAFEQGGDVRDGAAAAIALSLLGLGNGDSDRALVQASAQALLGDAAGAWVTDAWPSVAASAPRVDDDLAARMNAAVALSGGLVSGHVRTGVDAELIADVAAGDDGALVIWHQATGLGTQPLADGTPSGFDTAVGLQHTRLVAALVRTDAGPFAQTPVTLSRPPAPTARARRVDGHAAAAFDSERGEYQIVWSRRFSRGGKTTSQLMGVRLGQSGSLSGPERVLGTLEDAVDVQIGYDGASDTFAVAWASPERDADSEGAPLQLAILSGDGNVMGEPVTVAEGARRPALVAGGDGYLLSWTQSGHAGAELVCARVSTDGDVGERETIVRGRGVGLGSVAWDAKVERFRVAVHEQGPDGSWELAAVELDEEGVSGGPRRLRHDAMLYDPAVAAVSGAAVIAAATEDGRYFDGVGGLWAELETEDGASAELRLPRDETSFANIEMAADQRLIYIATSGEGGVRVDIVDALQSYGGVPERLVGMR